MVFNSNDHSSSNNHDKKFEDGKKSTGYTNEAFRGDDEAPGKKSLMVIDSKGKVQFTREEKWRILKNVAFISLAFMVQFTAFQGTANLQSSINAKDGLGTVSLSAMYAALMLSCMFVPTFLIKRLTVKWTLCVSMLCYAPYIAAQFYPRFYTLVPAGMILGLGAAPMWASKATYLTQVASVYAKLTEEVVDGIIVRFFGFFFLAWQTAELWGNLISSLVLSQGAHGTTHAYDNSRSYVNGSIVKGDLDLCGSAFCVSSDNINENLERPPDSEIFTMSTIFLACIATAILMIIFLLDPLTRYGEKQRKTDGPELTGLQLLSATANQMKKPLQQMLIPMTVYIGMEQAFLGADYTQAYISCAIGISYVGYVMVCFGIVNALCSLVFGTVMKYIGRYPIMTLGFLLHFSLVLSLLFWRPNPDEIPVFFAISGLWGAGDAVWQTQVNGLYGTLFRRHKEAAFSNYRLWESTGFVIAYAYGTVLCAETKLYIQLVVLCVGYTGYTIVEILQRRKKMRQKKAQEDPKAAAVAVGESETGKKGSVVEETDDEKDDIDDEIVITHL